MTIILKTITPAQMSLINDIVGDDSQGHMPSGYASLLIQVILRCNEEAVEELARGVVAEGWDAVRNGKDAQPWMLADSYITAATFVIAQAKD